MPMAIFAVQKCLKDIIIFIKGGFYDKIEIGLNFEIKIQITFIVLLFFI